MNIQTAIRSDKQERLRAAREEAWSTPLKDFHPGAPRLFQNDTLWPWFERLRKEEGGGGRGGPASPPPPPPPGAAWCGVQKNSKTGGVPPGRGGLGALVQ